MTRQNPPPYPAAALVMFAVLDLAAITGAAATGSPFLWATVVAFSVALTLGSIARLKARNRT